jgi:glycosyltransferase involved in cell wall biosynthesis
VVSEGINFDPLEKVPEKNREPIIIYVGRLKKAKRPDHIVKAFSMIVEQIPRAKLWIVGDGYLREDLERMAGNNVKFFGHVSEKEKIDLLSKAWVLVNPSIREGWGINIIEANACGTPCIAYNVPGLRDSIVDGETGLLVKGNAGVEELAKVLTEFLENYKVRQEFSKSALKWSKRFTWDKGAEESMMILESVTR